MAIEYAVGSVAAKTTTGEFSVTGLTFRPKLVTFWWTANTADGSITSIQAGMGGAVSSTSRFAVAIADLDGAAASDSGRYHTDAACYSVVNTDGTTVVLAADFVSFNSDGFTLNQTVASGAALIINYEAFGGSIEAAIKMFVSNSSTGSQAVTGVGFKPTYMALYGSRVFSVPPSGETHARLSFGATSGPSEEAAVGIAMNDAADPTQTSHAQTTAASWIGVNGADGLEQLADLTSFDSDGFTLNWSNVFGGVEIWAVCIRGVRAKVGQIAQPGGTGNSATTGIGFRPRGLRLWSMNDSTNSNGENHVEWSYGAGSSSTARGAVWFGSNDNAATTAVDSNLDRTKIIKMGTPGTPTFEAAADLVTFDADGFTLNWTSADGSARLIQYSAFGDGPTSPGSSGNAPGRGRGNPNPGSGNGVGGGGGGGQGGGGIGNPLNKGFVSWKRRGR